MRVILASYVAVQQEAIEAATSCVAFQQEAIEAAATCIIVEAAESRFRKQRIQGGIVIESEICVYRLPRHCGE